MGKKTKIASFGLNLSLIHISREPRGNGNRAPAPLGGNHSRAVRKAARACINGKKAVAKVSSQRPLESLEVGADGAHNSIAQRLRAQRGVQVRGIRPGGFRQRAGRGVQIVHRLSLIHILRIRKKKKDGKVFLFLGIIGLILLIPMFINDYIGIVTEDFAVSTGKIDHWHRVSGARGIGFVYEYSFDTN